MHSRPRRRRKKHITIDTVYEPPKSTVHMYEEAPALPEISIDEFENLAVERLQLLKIIERADLNRFKSDERLKFVKDNIEAEWLVSYFQFFGLLETGKMDAKRNDHISHFILRLACCKSVESRRWFVEKESQLFRLKFACLNVEEKEEFFKVYCKSYRLINFLDKFLCEKELSACTPDLDVYSTDFYEVPFYEVSALVAERKVYMSKGLVYLPVSEICEVLGYIFGRKLRSGLLEMCKCLEALESDERVKYVLENLQVAADARRTNFQCDLRLDHLDLYVENNFPACMEHLHHELVSKSHLKHEARLQYGRFLKDLGFECDQVLSIFRESFCKKMDESKFMKKYSYSIKYMFGLVGRKKVQKGFSCSGTIENVVICGKEHGCPYKHWDEANLENFLLRKGLALRDIEEIMTLKRRGDYQKACTKCFNCTHVEPHSKTVVYPSEYFKESRNNGGLAETFKLHKREMEESEEDTD